MGTQREVRNIDFLRGEHIPLQTYAWSGGQLGASLDDVNGKKPTDAAPMIITSQPPGIFARDNESWVSTFGASHDCVLSLFNGKKFKDDTLDNITLAEESVYRNAIGTADLHLYELIGGDEDDDEDPGVQQVDFIVGSDTVEAAQSGLTNITDVDQARTLSMRIPMMAAGWGRTVAMRPTDPSPDTDENKRLNDDEHKLARETWKLGPIDFRWDERRGVWGGWNDMIADHNATNLGTLVFSTNPDPVCGFPFLRGKLEDVFWVRRTTEKGGLLPLKAGQDSDFIQTGEVCTTLNHKWYDNTNTAAGTMNTAFIVCPIPGAESSAVCGTETTFDGQIEILVSTFFHQSDTNHGPICFTSDGIKDDDLVGCMKFDGGTWVPTVVWDVCDRVGDELNILYANDVELEGAITVVLGLFGGITATAQFKNGKTVVDASALAQSVQAAIEQTAQNVAASVSDALEDLRGNTESAINDLAAFLTICLAECGCFCNPPPASISPIAIDQISSGTVSGGELSGDVTGDIDVQVDVPIEVAAPQLENPCP